MGAEQFSNFSRSTIAAAVTATDTTITVADGSSFPSADFFVILDNENASREICWVTSRANNVLTLTTTSNRGQKSTVAQPHRKGASVVHTVLAHHIEDSITLNQTFIPGRPQGTLAAEYYFDNGVEGWTATAGTLTATNGTLSLSHSSSAFATSPDVPTGDYEILFENVNPSAAGMAMHVKYANANNRYSFYWSSSSNQWRLDKTVSGSATNIGFCGAPYVYNNSTMGGFRVLFRMVGIRTTIYVNDVMVMDLNDNALSANTGYGMHVNNGSITVQGVKRYSLAAGWNGGDWKGGKVDRVAGGDVTRWEPDAPPLTPSAWDDEFSDGVIDSAWSWVNQATSTVDEVDGKLRFRHPNQTSSPALRPFMRSAPTTTDWSIFTKVSIANMNSTSTIMGLCIRNSATNRMYSLGIGRNGTASGYTVRLHSWTSTTSATSITDEVWGQQSIYLRISKVGTNLTFGISEDGISWLLIATVALSAVITAVDQVGFAGYHSATGTVDADMLCDFFRASTDTDPRSKLLGRLVYLDRTGTIQAQASGSVATKTYTAGDLSDSSTTYVNVLTDLDLSVPASAGDIIEYSVSGLWSNQATTGRLDPCSLVGGVTTSLTGSSYGVPFWQGVTSRYDQISGTITYKVKSSDISNGMITIRLLRKNDSATAKILHGSTDNPLIVSLKNLNNFTVPNLRSDKDLLVVNTGAQIHLWSNFK